MTLFFIGFCLLRLMVFIFAVLLFIKIVSVIGKKMHGRHKEMYKKFRASEAISLAAQRYADGDISIDQYREIESVLEV